METASLRREVGKKIDRSWHLRPYDDVVVACHVSSFDHCQNWTTERNQNLREPSHRAEIGYDVPMNAAVALCRRNRPSARATRDVHPTMVVTGCCPVRCPTLRRLARLVLYASEHSQLLHM